MLDEVPASQGHGSGEATIKSVINKTRRPIRLLLPGGKTLYLGLGGRGQVPDDALDRPALKKLVEAGEIEVLEQDSRTVSTETVSTRIRRSPHGHPATRDTSRRGDR
jgi:hypothetical protein